MDITKLKTETNKDKIFDFLYDNRRIISEKIGFDIMKRMERDKICKDSNAAIFAYINEHTAYIFLLTSVDSLMITIEDLRNNVSLLGVYLSSYRMLPEEIKDALLDSFAEAIMKESRLMEEKLYAKLKQFADLINK